jgi:protein-disulfide isomerase
MKQLHVIFAIIFIALIPAYSQNEGGHLIGGSSKSPVRIEVFSDFECPYCREFYLYVIRPMLQDYSSKGSVGVVYFEYPLPSHKHSREAARYAEAAARISQQALLKVQDAFFREQADWSKNGKLEPVISKALSAQDMLQLKKNMQDSSINAAIEKDLLAGNQLGVTSTPTMFIYYPPDKRQKVDMSSGPLVYDTLKRFLDKVLK